MEILWFPGPARVRTVAPYNVYMRQYNWSLESDSGEALVNDNSGSFHGFNSSVAMNAAGEFVIAWEGEGSGDTTGIFATVFNAAGQKTVLDIPVNTTTSGDQSNVDVSINDSGEFVVSWEDTDGIYFQRFDAAGTKVGSEVSVRSNYSVLGIDTDYFHTSIDINNDDQVVIAYQYRSRQ